MNKFILSILSFYFFISNSADYNILRRVRTLSDVPAINSDFRIINIQKMDFAEQLNCKMFFMLEENYLMYLQWKKERPLECNLSQEDIEEEIENLRYAGNKIKKRIDPKYYGILSDICVNVESKQKYEQQIKALQQYIKLFEVD